MERDKRPKLLLRYKKIFCQIQIIFLYSTRNGHSEKSSAAPNAPFSQSLSQILLITSHAQRERGKVIGRGVHIYIYIYMSVVEKKI